MGKLLLSTVLLLLGLVLLPFVTEPLQAQLRESQDICLARWQFIVPKDDTEPHWDAPFPDNRMGSIDLRSIPEQGVPGGLGGWGFFAYDQSMGSNGLHCFGTNISDELTMAQVNTIAIVLGLGIDTVAQDSLVGVLQSLLVDFGDPTGNTSWRPIQMGKDGFEIVLGDRSIATQSFSLESKAFQNTVAVRWSDYRRQADARIPLKILRKWNGQDMLTYFGRMGDDLMPVLVPPEYQSHGWEKPSTTVSDNFDRADSTDLGADWTEVDGNWQILSNQLDIVSAGGTGRSYVSHDTSLSSDDHYSEAKIYKTDPNSGNVLGTLLRWQDSSNHYAVNVHDTFTDQHEIYKRVTGTPTVLASEFQAWTDGHTMRGEVNGSTLKFYRQGVEELSVTDSALSGQLQLGIWTDGTSVNFRWDDFGGADLGATPTAQVVMIN